MKKSAPVTVAVGKLAERIHSAEPDAAFAIQLWDGEIFQFGKTPRVVLHFKTPKSATDTLGKGFLGFGEAYMDGLIDIEGDLQELLRLGFAIGFDQHTLPFFQLLRFLAISLATLNTTFRSPRNISHHYDRGDDFYRIFLDPTMTYSCAYFQEEREDLETAQQNKYRHIAAKLMLKPGETLLDIGCGWGGMLFYAADHFGVKGVGNTLSRNQYEYVLRKIRERRLEGRLQVLLSDYRELQGTFDKVVSIGMFEHVGRQFIPTFMKKTAKLLNDGGLGLLHTIGKEVPAPPEPWIRRYIFPGGYIPTLGEIIDQMGRAGLSVLDVENLRPHYALTLDRWIQNFERNVDSIRDMFDEKFVRMWRLYLNGSSAGFKYGSNRVYQILFSKGLKSPMPLTRRHLYHPTMEKSADGESS